MREVRAEEASAGKSGSGGKTSTTALREGGEARRRRKKEVGEDEVDVEDRMDTSD